MRKLVLIVAITLAGCGQSPEEARQAARECRAHGGTPAFYVGADFRWRRPDGDHNQRVECFATYTE